MLFNIGVLKNFANLWGKYLCRSLLLIKLQVPPAYNFTKKRLQHGCFPVNSAWLLRAASLNSTYRWLPREMPCRICCFNLRTFSCCNGIKVEGTFGDMWIMLILLAAIVDLIWWKFIWWQSWKFVFWLVWQLWRLFSSRIN